MEKTQTVKITITGVPDSCIERMSSGVAELSILGEKFKDFANINDMTLEYSKDNHKDIGVIICTVLTSLASKVARKLSEEDMKEAIKKTSTMFAERLTEKLTDILDSIDEMVKAQAQNKNKGVDPINN